MEIATLYELFKQYPHITTDTRNCPPDSIFFALKGDNFNGNKFAQQAIDSGCSYAVIDEAEYATNDKLLLVDDVLKTLQQLANHHRKTLKLPIIGITGTNGKTTTKELVTAVLSKDFNVASTKGNLNNHIGVPLTLLSITKEHEIAIVEMGASHVGEIKELAEIAEPNFGLITNIGEAHLEGFGSFENIIKAKRELYDFIKTQNNGKVFVDFDNDILRNAASEDGITAIYYGTRDEMFVAGRILDNNPFLKFEWRFSQRFHTVQTRLIGAYNLSNALAAITIGKYFGVRSPLVSEAIEEYVPTNNRSQLKQTDKNIIIIDAYNANPTSMKAALENFANLDAENKALILGEMRELGENSKTEHQNIVNYIADRGINNVFLIGHEFEETENGFKSYKNIDEFSKYLSENPILDSYILLKGSRGVQLEKCLELL